MLKLSTSVCITIFLTAIFVVGIAATTYYYYGMPHPTSLRILYTHSDEMVDEIVRDFEKWYHQECGEPIEVTATLTNPETAFDKVTTKHKKAEAEIWWGGSLSLFKKARGRLLAYNSTYKNDINLTCHSCPLMDLSGNTPRWYAASLYGVGVMYNEHRLETLGLRIPQTWADLTFHKHQGNITMTDPAESEFTSPFVMLILESKNWTGGWEYLVTLSALIEQYEANEHDSALKVSNDYLPLALVPDFYAYDRMAVGVPQINFTYLDATILQPDPIAIISKGTYIGEAKAFIDYILTTRAQDITGKYLLPMRQDVTTFPSEFSPFDPNFSHVYRYNETLQGIIGDYYKAWITQRHDKIKIAYGELREANKTKDVNSNATYYFNMAWGNFTYAGYYRDCTYIENLFIETKGWTENVGSYMDEWEIASNDGYNNALMNAQESRQAAKSKHS